MKLYYTEEHVYSLDERQQLPVCMRAFGIYFLVSLQFPIMQHQRMDSSVIILTG
jgi:hypothetical protein